jgi:hypothetical protein
MMPKKTMRRPRTHQCAYCGKVTTVTKDHVVPKGLFVQPYPTNLITVPACAPCNNAKSLDDDYLRDLLVCDLYGSESPVAKQVFRKMLGSDSRGSSIVARAARAEMQFKPLHSHGGVYLGQFPSFPIDGPRLERIFKTLVRGLYYDARRQYFPEEYIFELRRFEPWDFERVLNEYQRHNPNGPRVLGDVFGCIFLSAIEDPFTTLWLMWFYERILFSVAATNSELAEAEPATV